MENNSESNVIPFPDLMPSSVIIRKLTLAEDKLAKNTEEIHRRNHRPLGHPRSWTRCWNPICVETRRAFGEVITEYEAKNRQTTKYKQKYKITKKMLRENVIKK